MTNIQNSLEIVEADLSLERHQKDVVTLTAAYALDEMGNGGPLPSETLEELVPALRRHPTTLIFLAYLDGNAVGIANCFLGFSTFKARPLVNVHDLAVLPEYRGRNIGPRLLQAVEQKALELGCCKVTLEVQEGNTRARHVYASQGFAQALYGDENGGSLFYSKPL